MATQTKPNSSNSFAYLVIRDGSKWSDVFRLIPGRTVTIGRSPTNQVVIREEQASRRHAELFQTEGQWVIRDLNSRNGTAVGDERLTGDRPLEAGDVIWISKAQLVFVHDLSSAYDKKLISRGEIGDATMVGLELDEDQDPDSMTVQEPETITHRRQKTKFLEQDAEIAADSTSTKMGRAAAKLCRLAFELANESTIPGIAGMALDSLLEGTGSDAGAVLMIPGNKSKIKDPKNLDIVGWRSENQPNYQRVSKFLGATVLNEGEAVLARDIADDSALSLRDSHGEILATSVICAPIRANKRIIGLLHHYSTQEMSLLDPDDLEFTLAVAETIGLAIRTRYREQKLVEDLSKTRTEIDQLREQLGVDSEIVGSSPAMLAVHRQVARAAPSNATVLIRGESGVGKELVARAVHFSSKRSKGAFVCLNCAALSESLLESELFGHEKGAFTGATDRKMGKFESADKGTLMLDEIGEMSQEIQAKFLRVLEGHPFERLGGSTSIKVDARVIAATNRDLEKAVREGKFRKDLFFRLHVIQIDVPPLRRRPEDVLELANYFLQKYNVATGRKITGFSPQALTVLSRYRWPGNVRELKNVIERAVVLAREDVIQVDEILLSNLNTASESTMDFQGLVGERPYQPISLAEVEAKHIEATLLETGWNKSRSASILGIERSTLDRKIKKYKITKIE